MIGLRVLTIGTFDGFHQGHANLLKRCRKLCGAGFVYVGVNSDRFVEEYKGRGPEQDEETRLQRAGKEREVSAALLNDGSGAELIRSIEPDFLVVGSDWLEKDYLEQIGMTPEELFEELGLWLVFVPRTPGVSSSGLRR